MLRGGVSEVFLFFSNNMIFWWLFWFQGCFDGRFVVFVMVNIVFPIRLDRSFWGSKAPRVEVSLPQPHSRRAEFTNFLLIT